MEKMPHKSIGTSPNQATLKETRAHRGESKDDLIKSVREKNVQQFVAYTYL